LAGFLGLCLGVQLIGGVLTGLSVGGWYETLSKPSWNPPGWVFGPVWTYLYLSMGFAAWLIWQRRTTANVRPALTVFAFHLIFNVLWSGLFFGLRNPLAAFIDIIILWLGIAATLVAFWRIRPLAGLLFVPYLVWVTFAGSLNYAIWRMNV
jgi:tryptophan-rich sensory protein